MFHVHREGIDGGFTIVDVPKELVVEIEGALRRHGRELKRVVGDVLTVAPPSRVSPSVRPYDGSDAPARRAT